MKAHKWQHKVCTTILAVLTEKALEDKRLEDIPIVRGNPKVFLEDLLDFHPHIQDEVQNYHMPVPILIGRAPYCLPPNELQELSKQLQELLEKGFIHQSASP